MLENVIQKRIDELEKEKYKQSIEAKRLKDIDVQLEQYREMLKGLRKDLWAERYYTQIQRI